MILDSPLQRSGYFKSFLAPLDKVQVGFPIQSETSARWTTRFNDGLETRIGNRGRWLQDTPLVSLISCGVSGCSGLVLTDDAPHAEKGVAGLTLLTSLISSYHSVTKTTRIVRRRKARSSVLFSSYSVTKFLRYAPPPPSVLSIIIFLSAEAGAVKEYS